MGDVQQYYIDHGVRNHYSVSISGYHIAEAGANPITQLAFTLANGFTYVEYYRSRGMDINKFAPNLSFFFSNGLDPEYTVIGRVARRIWSVAMRDLYGADERSQKLKYHIQTSGRSLHAQEIDFNDIRTTLQALLAIQDNANSLHTNAYDEAITTPTEESVRRALAIQLIVNKESGWTKTENPMQGSYIVEELTDLVEQAVLSEFEAISRRGGVLGAMETMYQRGKIQDESMYYEHLKHDGTLPIIGVNTFQNPNAAELTEENADQFDMELARATPEEKQACLDRINAQKEAEADKTAEMLKRLQEVSRAQGNVFEELMETTKYATLGQITEALFNVGGKYRRNLIIEKCQVPIFYLRLSNAGKTQRLLFDYKYTEGADGKVKFVYIWLLAIANKKDIQSSLPDQLITKSTPHHFQDWIGFQEELKKGKICQIFLAKNFLIIKKDASKDLKT